jgi:hypothetical protein
MHLSDNHSSPDPAPARPRPQSWLTQPEHLDGTIPLSHPIKQKLQDGLVALSLANLLFIRAWFAALYDADFGYFNKLRVTAMTLLALATNLAWTTALAWLMIRAWRRWQNRWFHLAIHLLFLSVLLVPLDFIRGVVFNCHLSRVFAQLKHPVVGVPTGLALALILWQHRKAARAAALLVGILSPLALFVVARTALLLLGVENLAQHGAEPALPLPSPVRPNQPRVLWVIFDETDQRLAFEQRPTGVALPEFDRLRAQSLASTNAFPPGDRTMLSMPALISGQRLATVEIKEPSDLTLILADTHTPTNWSCLPSVFGSARQLGVNTALVGWDHPYRRVLGRELNYCEWFPFPGTEPTRGPTFSGTLLRQIMCPAGPFLIRYLFANTCRASLACSLTLVTNDTYGLTLLHLPPPHEPGVYNPKTGRYVLSIRPETTEYFNNLALADRFLGTLRRAMERTGDWDKTWFIMSADHSWRRSKVYDGRRDLRIPFLVKVPGQAGPVTYSSRMNTVLTHDLILAILRGDLHDTTGLVSWLDTHRSSQETISDDPKVPTH